MYELLDMISEQIEGYSGGVGGLVVGALPLPRFSTKFLDVKKLRRKCYRTPEERKAQFLGFFNISKNIFTNKITNSSFLEYMYIFKAKKEIVV